MTTGSRYYTVIGHFPRGPGMVPGVPFLQLMKYRTDTMKSAVTDGSAGLHLNLWLIKLIEVTGFEHINHNLCKKEKEWYAQPLRFKGFYIFAINIIASFLYNCNR